MHEMYIASLREVVIFKINKKNPVFMTEAIFFIINYLQI